MNQLTLTNQTVSMGVDKFGRHSVSRRNKGLRGPRGEGFNLTDEGNYDIKQKRLCNVYDPAEGYDAVNYKTFSDGLQKCITGVKPGEFDAQGKRLSNLAEPIDGTDSVNKTYVDLRIPIRSDANKEYNMHYYRIKDVGAPKHRTDAVNLEYVNTNALVKDINGKFDARNTIIHSLADPVSGKDAVNKNYTDKKFLRSTGSVFDMTRKRVANVADPVQDNDAVNVKYLKLNTMNPVKSDTSKWDARNMQITNIAAKPSTIYDAVSLGYLKEIIGDLSYTLYKEINKGKRAATIPEAEWKDKVLEVKWDDLFK